MSRVGKQPIKIAQGVKVNLAKDVLKIEGPKGKLSHQIPDGIVLKIEKDHVLVTRDEKSENPNVPSLHGVTRTLIHNMVHGVATGFVKELDIVGVGFRAAVTGSTLTLNLGFSHPVTYKVPEGITVKVDKNTHLIVSGADKVLVGMVAAKIRSFRPPEPYQGKGVKYTEERIIRKQGKAAGAK